jgi:hypothetical protein
MGEACTDKSIGHRRNFFQNACLLRPHCSQSLSMSGSDSHSVQNCWAQTRFGKCTLAVSINFLFEWFQNRKTHTVPWHFGGVSGDTGAMLHRWHVSLLHLQLKQYRLKHSCFGTLVSLIISSLHVPQIRTFPQIDFVFCCFL